MLIELDRKDLESLVRGNYPNYSEFNNSLVKKAGHSYNDQYSKTSWNSLGALSDNELYELYLLCRNSWPF